MRHAKTKPSFNVDMLPRRGKQHSAVWRTFGTIGTSQRIRIQYVYVGLIRCLGKCRTVYECTAAYTFNEYRAEQKGTCLGECMLPCVRHSCACNPTDVHMWQIVVRQEFPLTFAHLLPTWRTLANSEQTWPNAFVHICCKVHP